MIPTPLLSLLLFLISIFCITLAQLQTSMLDAISFMNYKYIIHINAGINGQGGTTFELPASAGWPFKPNRF